MHAHVFSRSGYFSCLHSEYAERNHTVFIVSILYNVYSLTTVTLNHAIIYATALSYLYKIVYSALFLKIFYNKLLLTLYSVVR